MRLGAVDPEARGAGDLESGVTYLSGFRVRVRVSVRRESCAVQGIHGSRVPRVVVWRATHILRRSFAERLASRVLRRPPLRVEFGILGGKLRLA